MKELHVLLTVVVYVRCPLKTYVYRKSISGYDKNDDYTVTPTSVKGGQEILYYHGQVCATQYKY